MGIVDKDVLFRSSYYIQIINALLLLGLSIKNFKTALEEKFKPIYHLETHDSCHSLSYLLGFLMIWYCVLVMTIVLNRSTRSQDWALKMLGFPTMLLSGFTCAILVLLAIMYEHHDEHWFAGILALGCSGFLAFVSIFSLVILRNPVEQRDPDTAKRWTFMLLFFLVVVTGLHFYNEFYTLFVLSTLSTAIFIFALNLVLDVAVKLD